LGLRKDGVDETRQRVIVAARDVFSEAQFYRASLDDVATRAGVARATVYYQFKSKMGLLEAAIEGVLAGSTADRLRNALEQPDPVVALRRYVTEICRLWHKDETFYRNVIGLAAIDEDARHAVAQYDARRREHLIWLVKRLYDGALLQPGVTHHQAVDVIWLLTSFRSFHALRRWCDLPEQRAAALLQDLSLHVLARA
jgi:AcrR family transcriptional regulator